MKWKVFTLLYFSWKYFQSNLYYYMFIACMQVCSPLFGVLHVCPYFTGWSIAAEDYMGMFLSYNMYFVLSFPPSFFVSVIVYLVFWQFSWWKRMQRNYMMMVTCLYWLLILQIIIYLHDHLFLYIEQIIQYCFPHKTTLFIQWYSKKVRIYWLIALVLRRSLPHQILSIPSIFV